MNKICTSLEQSKKLIELGIDINTADIIYTTFYGKVSKNLPMPKEVYDILKYPYPGDKCVPAWSLSALLIILPQGTRLLKSATSEMYHCDCPKGNIDKWFDNPIDAAFEMVVWLKENNKL